MTGDRARIFITGGTGCIGSATVHQLLAQAHVEQILVLSRSSDTRLLRMWLGETLDERLQLAAADIGDQATVASWLHRFQPSHVIHLGALQTPACDADPQRGMAINVGGTLSLLQTLRELPVPPQRFVFASSAAVYGRREIYPGPTVSEDSTLAPPNLYGVWKVAGEHLAALFQQQTGIPTICLRLNTTYGPGRDQGKTSAPTLALKTVAMAAQLGRPLPFRMPYQGRENYHYVEDVGAHFAGVARMPFDGFGAFNIKGRTVEVRDYLERVRRVAGELGMGESCDLGISESADPNLFVCDLDDQLVEQYFPGLPRTPLETGIRNSLVLFRDQARHGELHIPM